MAVDTLEELNKDAIDPAWIDAVDMDMPQEYLDELMAQKLLQAVAGYHASETERKALRHQGEHQKAEQMAKQAATCRATAAIIQHEHPKAVPIYRSMAVREARRASEAGEKE